MKTNVPLIIFSFHMNSCTEGIISQFSDGFMYWSDWGTNARIEKAGMDGSERSVFLSENIGLPNGLVVDYDSSRVYWADAKLKTLEYIEFNGRGRTILGKYKYMIRFSVFI